MRLYFPPGWEDHVAIFEDHFELIPTCELSRAVDGFYLTYSHENLRLCLGADRKGVSIAVSDITRRANLELELSRACGVTRASRLTVLDLMSGWGVDGLTLQRLGCTLTCLEVSTIAWALLQNLIERSGADDIKLLNVDAWDWLDQCDEFYDVVYLDPMFPERRKKALPNKRIQYLGQLVSSPEHDLRDWIARARLRALSRVVLKRRLHDPQVGNPNWQISGRTVRYDVYRGKA